MRHLALYLSGPLVVALLVPFALGVVDKSLYGLIVIGTIPVVLLFTLLIAAPLFMLVARADQAGWPRFAALAFVAGFVSFVVFGYLSAPSYSGVGSVVHVYNGKFTAAGWRQLLVQSLAVGAASIPGGVLWWLGARTPLEES